MDFCWSEQALVSDEFRTARLSDSQGIGREVAYFGCLK
jgi:hypothetical protein